jgi:hypothetical protein
MKRLAKSLFPLTGGFSGSSNGLLEICLWFAAYGKPRDEGVFRVVMC